MDSSITRGGGAGTADALRGKGKKERNGSNHWCPHPLANDDGFHCDIGTSYDDRNREESRLTVTFSHINHIRPW